LFEQPTMTIWWSL